MSNVARVAGQAANTTVAPLSVEGVFSTYVYDGNGSTQTITNGIDLAGEGGLVWTKSRNSADYNLLLDTERGIYKWLSSNGTGSENTTSTTLTSFNSDGFSLGSSTSMNGSGLNIASWTWRKAPKFFDVVTYTGNGSSQTINHNLGTTVGAIIIKCTDTGTNWAYWHRTFGSQEMLMLNATAATRTDLPYISDVTDSSFTVNIGSSFINENTKNHIAYVFAHNDGDGDFGPTGDQDIIKCGSFTTDGSGVANVDLGFEPAWLLTKASSTTSYWALMDEMRGFGADVGMDYMVQPNTANAEVGPNYLYKKNATGFSTASLSANQTYIYIAIRRGPMAVPESATDVFALQAGDSSGTPEYTSGFPVDMAIAKSTSGSSTDVAPRLTQGLFLQANTTGAESSGPAYAFDYQDGYFSSSSSWFSWMWRRAPSFFDVVAYTGDGVAGRTVSHNLGVAPEMMWVRRRNETLNYWNVYHSALGATDRLILNENWASGTVSTTFNNTEPTSSSFTVGSNVYTNGSGDTFIAYLFASLDGVSKVGSYTGNGTSQNIDCGFSSGARFVLIKSASTAGNWILFDSERGIVAGNDPFLVLNTTGAESSAGDYIDPYSAGFTLPSATLNTSGVEWIFYAIA